jgi:hypothetical protein
MNNQSPELKFSFDVSENFVDECATFLRLPADDGLTRASAQLFASNFDLRRDLTHSVDNLTHQVGTQWNSLQINTVDALSRTVQVVGDVSIRHQDISAQLAKSTNLYEQSLTSNQQLQESLLELTTLYQTSQQENLKLHGNLEIFVNGLSTSEKVKNLQIQDFQHSLSALTTSMQQPQRHLLSTSLEIKKDLSSLSSQLQNSPDFEQNLTRLVRESVKQLSNENDKNLRTAHKSLEILQENKNEMAVSLSNLKFICFGLGTAVFTLFSLLLWSSSAKMATSSANNAHINTFGGEQYHRVALRIMDAGYRKENFTRLERCREKNKKIQSPIMECPLKVESNDNNQS